MVVLELEQEADATIVEVLIAKRLRELMRRDQIDNAHQLAQMMSRSGHRVSQPTLHRILRGERKSIKDTTVRALAAYFKITTAQMRGEVELSGASVSLQGSASDIRQEHRRTRSESIPVLRWEQIINFLHDDHAAPEGYASMDVVLSRAAKSGQKRLLVTVRDPSMINPSGKMPTFPPGLQLVCNAELSPEHGNFVLVRRNDEATPILRQYVLDGSRVMLHALNSDYRDEPFSARDEVLAVVEKISHDLYYNSHS